MNGLLAAELEIRFTDFRFFEVKFALFALHNFDSDIYNMYKTAGIAQYV
jgi:hypothetical protein